MIIQRLECGGWLTHGSSGGGAVGDVLPCSCYTKLMADLEELGWPRWWVLEKTKSKFFFC